MKHIQAYEKKLNKKFWILETNPETFQLALDKTGINKNDSLYTFLLNRYVFKWRPNWIYTNLIKQENDGKVYWTYGGSGSDSVIGKYMGNINLTELDKVADQYNL